MTGLLDRLRKGQTSFATFEMLDVGGTGRSLTFDGNSKVTCDDGSFEQPVANCLSLPNVASCPGATPACLSSCYVHGLNASKPELAAAYARNMSAIQWWLMAEGTFHRSAADVAGYASNFERFRWHVSGDVFSLRYASWIARVCELASETQFWIYTRTLQAVPTLLAENLAVNISADSDNWSAIRDVLHGAKMRYLDCLGYDRARICYMLRDGEHPPELPPGSVIFPDYGMRAAKRPDLIEDLKPSRQHRMICPADYFGQSPRHRCGPCKKCLRPARS